MSKILCVDFDGVIHSYTSGWKSEARIPDPPVPGALWWLWQASERFEVVIYSSRSKSVGGRTAMFNWLLRHCMDVFPSGHPMLNGDMDSYPIKFASEKPAAFLTIDDRAICFTGSFEDLDLEKLAGFKTWMQK